MSSSIRAVLDDIEECWAFLDRHNIKDLTLQERYEAKRGNLDKLKALLENRGVQLSPGLQLKPDNSNIDEQDIFEKLSYGPLTPENETVVFPEVDWAEWDGVLPPDAEVFFDDGEFAFYRTSGSDTIGIYVTESQSDPVEDDEVDIRTMIRVLDNMTFVLEEIRTNLVRML